jgi:hypothetical protein
LRLVTNDDLPRTIGKDEGQVFANFQARGGAAQMAISPPHECKTSGQRRPVAGAVKNAPETFERPCAFCQSGPDNPFQTLYKRRTALATGLKGVLDALGTQKRGDLGILLPV